MAKISKKLLDATTSPYAAAYTRWPKVAGVAPTTDELATIHAMNIRPGCKHALACAMYLRAEGATDAEVIAAARLLDKNPAGRQGVLHNYAFAKGGLVDDGLVKRDITVPHRDGARVYKITLTPKGTKARDKWLSKQTVEAPAPVKPVKAKRPRKAKAPALPAAPVAEDAPQVAMPMSVEDALAVQVNTDK